MGKQRVKQPPPGRPGWRWAALGALGLIVVGTVAAWWLWEVSDASGGTARLVVDRAEVDLGYRRFDTLARVEFTLTNAGGGPLRLKEVPPVVVKAGC